LQTSFKQSTQQKVEKKKEQKERERERTPKSEPELLKNLGYTTKSIYWIRASPAVLSMRSCTSKIEWRKVKTCCRFGSGKWFWLTIIMHSLRWLVNGPVTLCTCREECTKYDLTAGQCFWLAHRRTDWSKWFAISSPPPIRCPNFSFIGWGWEKSN
jgi:hypothetical protein